MNNQRSSKGEQFLRFILLWIAATLIFNHFFSPSNKNKPATAARPAPTLQKAFEGIDPKIGTPLSVAAGQAEVAKLQKEIDTDGTDDYSYWARLRSGLIQQYVLGKLNVVALTVSPLSRITSPFSPPPTQGTIYDQIISHGASNDIDAQAVYQKGDMLYRDSTKNGGPPSAEAAQALELLIHRGRAASAFLDLKIFIPALGTTAPAGAVPAGAVPTLGKAAIPPQGFTLARVRDLRMSTNNPGHPDPPGILERINAYYATTPFYKAFDGAVRLLGNNPAYSYGIVIILFSLVTRLLLQPFNKKQYESMRGMQLIQPEIKKIQEKYKGKSDQQEQMKMIKEMRELQARHGVNPQMGCVLALVQWPVFLFLIYPMIQHYEPKMELAGASFLWIHSLAHPDIAILILYALSMMVSFRLSSAPPTDDQQRMMTTMMTFAMPIMLPFFMQGFSSAFILYWMTFNMMSTFLQYRLMKAADPNKNVIKTLMGQSAITSSTTTSAAIPPRPGKKKTPTTFTVEAVENSNGSKNGKASLKRADSLNDRESLEESAVALDGAAESGLNGTATVSEAGVSANGSGPKSGKNPRPGDQRPRRRRRH